MSRKRFNLIQQRRHLRRIIGVLIREGLRDYHATASIDRQMEFAPFAERDFAPCFASSH
jgi:hypothetical protein